MFAKVGLEYFKEYCFTFQQPGLSVYEKWAFLR